MGSQGTSPDYGNRLLPVTIDEIAKEEPSRAWASLPREDSDLSQGYVDVTYEAFAKGINELAWLIDRYFGRSKDFETIAYLGVPDIRYHMLQMAAAKTGYKILFSSHNNALAGHLTLMYTTKCTSLLSASSVAVDDILAARQMHHVIIPELDDLLDHNTAVKHYPFSKTFEEAAGDPYLILHTSGSTGFPKPFTFRHGGMAAVDRLRALPDVDRSTGCHRRFTNSHPGVGCRILLPFYQFHAAASCAIMCITVFGGAVYIPGFRHRIASRDDLFDVLDYANIHRAVLSPAMAEDLAASTKAPDYLKGLSGIIYGGAALTQAAGKLISKYCELQNQWGATESLNAVDLWADPEDFEYYAIDRLHSGAEFRPISDEDDLYELIFHKTPSSYPYISYFHNCPGETMFRPGDLWRPHPDPKKAPYTFRFAGRSDDLINFKDGINFHPVAYELKHSEHALVRNTVICGTGHAQPVLIVELQEPDVSDEQKPMLFERLWDESIKVVNKSAPKNGQIAKTHVIIATKEKPFERSVKGTVARKATIKKYETEIQGIYRLHGDRVVEMSGRH